MLKASIVFVLIAATTRVAYPCINETMRGDEAIKLVGEIEKHLDNGQYRQAVGKLSRAHAVLDPRLQVRLTDARALVALRTRTKKDDVSWTVEHFTRRDELKANQKDVRFRAWLAEAHAGVGKVEPALAILADLQKRDLMPDGFAYVTLASLSSGGERDAALAACKARAKAKSICVVPARRAATASKEN